LRALIVDDEPLARRGIALRLQKLGDIEIIGECGDGESAIKSILELSPDLVFLDVQMPEMDGFEVLRALPKENLPRVIFVTAHEQYALRAFEVHAVDYLLKPIDGERFAASVARARQFEPVAGSPVRERILKLLEEGERKKWVSRFPVRTGSRIEIVLIHKIEWIGAAGDYSELHCRGRSYLLRETMKSLEAKLDPKKFMRIHRSRIVRTDCIHELRAIENREYLLKISGGAELRSSRTYADRIEQWLSNRTD
jgi:two-component system LytT family response regulator